MEGPDAPAPVKRAYHLKPHGAYPLYVCPTCGFAVGSNAWRAHRRACVHRQSCAACKGTFPCRTRGCAKREVDRVQIPTEWPGEAPRARELARYGMRALRRRRLWKVWLRGEDEEHVKHEPTWRAAYEAAVKRKEGAA